MLCNRRFFQAPTPLYHNRRPSRGAAHRTAAPTRSCRPTRTGAVPTRAAHRRPAPTGSAFDAGFPLRYDDGGLVAEVTSLNVRPPRSPRGRIPHARLFGKRLRLLRNDVHIAHLLKQNLELKALVRALAEKYLEGKSRAEVRQLLHDVLLEQRRIYNEALSRQAIREARSVDELLLMLDEIRETDALERGDAGFGPASRRGGARRDMGGADGAPGRGPSRATDGDRSADRHDDGDSHIA